MLLEQQFRNELLVKRATLARELQREFAAVVDVLDALDQPLFQKVTDRAADGRFVRSCALRNVLCRAGIIPKAERGENPPLGNIQAVARAIFAGEFRADLRRQPVQPERHESEQVELGQGVPPIGWCQMVAVATILAMV